MKIFLLTNCQHADYHVVSAHLKREFAEKAKARLRCPEHPDIEEMEVDEPTSQSPRDSDKVFHFQDDMRRG